MESMETASVQIDDLPYPATARWSRGGASKNARGRVELSSRRGELSEAGKSESTVGKAVGARDYSPLLRVACSSSRFLKERIEEEDEEEVKAEMERGEAEWRRGKEELASGPMAVAGTGIGIVHVRTTSSHLPGPGLAPSSSPGQLGWACLFD